MSYPRLLAAAALLTACGDLNDSAYPGDERYQVAGVIESLRPASAGTRSYAAVEWQTATIGTPGSRVLGEVSPIEFPAPFDLPLYGLPADDEWAVTEGQPPVGVIAIARILVFEDINGNGELGAGDRWRGITPTVVVYARDVPADMRAEIRDRGEPITNIDAIAPGFQMATMLENRSITLSSDPALRTSIVITEPPPQPDALGTIIRPAR